MIVFVIFAQIINRGYALELQLQVFYILEFSSKMIFLDLGLELQCFLKVKVDLKFRSEILSRYLTITK